MAAARCAGQTKARMSARRPWGGLGQPWPVAFMVRLALSGTEPSTANMLSCERLPHQPKELSKDCPSWVEKFAWIVQLQADGERLSHAAADTFSFGVDELPVSLRLFEQGMRMPVNRILSAAGSITLECCS